MIKGGKPKSYFGSKVVSPRGSRKQGNQENARFQPAPDQADQARITASMFDKSENPIVIEAPKEVIQIRL